MSEPLSTEPCRVCGVPRDWPRTRHSQLAHRRAQPTNPEYRRGYQAGHQAARMAARAADAAPEGREELWAKFTGGEKLAYGCGFRDGRAQAAAPTEEERQHE